VPRNRRHSEEPSPASSLSICACFQARSAARAITDAYDRTLEPSGIRLTQVAILGAVHARTKITMQELASQLGLDPSTMTRTLRPLEDGGWIRVCQCGDKRAKQLELTPSGRAKLRECGTLWERAQRELRETLGAKMFDRLVTDLTKVNQVLRGGARNRA
jgi:DNA-binding MarR family transcriptional regulator